MKNIKDLAPEILWKYFDEILKIPRLSKNEEKIIDYLMKFGQDHDLETIKDSSGNIVIKKNATTGFENRKTVVLQSHMDMVGEKDDKITHNFMTDPIKAYIDGDWIKSEGTTLGADDGIGIAAQLAILSSSEVKHGPLECLFTVDEESGLTGAKNLPGDFIKGEILLNLDSEDEGELFIGCAGGMDTIGLFTINLKKPPSKLRYFKISVKGLRGGHSGDEIHKYLGNAIKIMNRFLWGISKKFGARLSHFSGGSLRNAIPREATATIGITAKETDDFNEFLDQYYFNIKNEIGKQEPAFTMESNEVDRPAHLYDKKSQKNLLNALYALPHGVISWSQTIENLVETSTNLAVVQQKKDILTITTSQRSSLDSAKRDISNRVESIFTLAGAHTEKSNGYPGWVPDNDSEILAITRETYSQLFNDDPKVKAIHAGLECGLFLEKYPNLDMISFGPTIKGAHTPQERLHIESTRKFWELLLHVLQRIPE